MIAHYGYRDAEGEFYITIDTESCAACVHRGCIAACPRAILVEEEDPYGDPAIAVDDRKRRQLRYECMPCKPAGDRPALPCVVACPHGAIRHSW